MILTEQQKELLFIALSSLQDTLYYNEDLEKIDYDYQNFRLSTYQLNSLTKDFNKLEQLIDKTLSDLC